MIAGVKESPPQSGVCAEAEERSLVSSVMIFSGAEISVIGRKMKLRLFGGKKVVFPFFVP